MAKRTRNYGGPIAYTPDMAQEINERIIRYRVIWFAKNGAYTSEGFDTLSSARTFKQSLWRVGIAAEIQPC